MQTKETRSTRRRAARQPGGDRRARRADHGQQRQSDPFAAELLPAHGIDFRCVRWPPIATFAFTPSQAAVVAQLWTAWLFGTPDVGDATLLERAGGGGSSIRSLFRIHDGPRVARHPAMGAMLVSGRTRGTHRIKGEPPPGLITLAARVASVAAQCRTDPRLAAQLAVRSPIDAAAIAVQQMLGEIVGLYALTVPAGE